VDNDVETALKRAAANENAACGVPASIASIYDLAVVAGRLPIGT
jgi:hypothetical protein